MFRGTKQECYAEMNRLVDSWMESLPDETTIAVEKV